MARGAAAANRRGADEDERGDEPSGRPRTTEAVRLLMVACCDTIQGVCEKAYGCLSFAVPRQVLPGWPSAR